jgi:hypothetical protein
MGKNEPLKLLDGSFMDNRTIESETTPRWDLERNRVFEFL